MDLRYRTKDQELVWAGRETGGISLSPQPQEGYLFAAS